MSTRPTPPPDEPAMDEVWVDGELQDAGPSIDELYGTTPHRDLRTRSRRRPRYPAPEDAP